MRMLALFLFAFLPTVVSAATMPSLTLGTVPESVQVGELFSVPIVLSSHGQDIDTVRLRLLFEPNHLEAVRFTLGSAFPNVSPANFLDNIAGVVYEGGFTTNGLSSNTVTFGQVTFRAKTVGKTTLTVDGGSLLLSAGEQTNVGASSSTTSFEVQASDGSEPSSPQAVDSKGKPLFTITSPGLGSDETWAKTSDVTIQWQVQALEQFSRFYFDFDQKPGTVASKPLPADAAKAGRMLFTNVADGIWYFHLRGRLQDGSSVSALQRVQIDTQAPNLFTPYFDRNEINAGESVLVHFGTIDQTSGVAAYDVMLDDQDLGLQNSPYAVTVNKDGEHIIRVIAVDKAGNTNEGHLKLVVKLAPPTAKYSRIAAMLAIIGILFGGIFIVVRRRK